MAIKRKDLAFLDDESADMDAKKGKILDLIHGEVDTLRDEKDEIQRQLDAATKNLETEKTARAKAEKDLTDYKTEQSNKESRTAKETALKGMLKELGMNDKRILTVIKAERDRIDQIEFNQDGTVKGAEKLKGAIKEDYSEFCSDEHTDPAHVETPPGGNTTVDKAAFEAMTLSDKMKFANEHPAEYANLSK